MRPPHRPSRDRSRRNPQLLPRSPFRQNRFSKPTTLWPCAALRLAPRGRPTAALSALSTPAGKKIYRPDRHLLATAPQFEIKDITTITSA